MGKALADFKKGSIDQDQYPFSVADARALTLEAAGFDPIEVGQIVRKATDKLIQKLDAKKTQYFSKDGIVLDERTDEDNASQIKAASELATIGIDVMALRRRSSNENPPAPAVTVDLSGWTVQAPPQPIEAIDATSTESPTE